MSAIVGQLEFPKCIEFSLLRCVLVELCEENLVLHKYVVGKGRSVLTPFSDNLWIFFAATPKLDKW